MRKIFSSTVEAGVKSVAKSPETLSIFMGVPPARSPRRTGLLGELISCLAKYSIGLLVRYLPIKAFQIGAATTEPSAPLFISEKLLLPTQTPAASDGV